MYAFRIIVSAIVLFSFSSAVFADETISLKAGYQLLSPDGEVAAEVSGVGSKINLDSDLGLGDSNDMMMEAAVALGDVKLTIGYLPLSFTGNSTLPRTILFNGEAFAKGTKVTSNLDLDILDVGLTWFLLNFDDLPTRFQLGVELAAKITDAEASITEIRTGDTGSTSATVPIPTIGLRTRVALSDFIGLNGRIGYLAYGDNHFMDADLQLEVSPIPLLGAFAGYRYLDLAIDESDVFVDSSFSGFYGGAFVRF